MAAIISIDLDTSTKGITTRRTAVVGETFVIHVMIEDDGTGISPVVFDTIVFGVYFNDSTPDVLGVTKVHFPHAGNLVSKFHGTVDAFSEKEITENMELSLWPVEDKLPEGYHNQAGRAGFKNLANPFVVRHGDKPMVLAAGKLNAGFHAKNIGTSRILASASVNSAEMMYKGKPMFAKTIPSVVTVLPERKDGPKRDIMDYPEDPIPPIKRH